MHDVQRLVVVVAVGAFSAVRLDAQRRGASVPLDPARVGPHLGYNFDAQALSLGLQATLSVTYQVEFYPTFDYYFVSPGSLWALNFDVKIRPRTPRRALYVGGGLDYLHSSNGVASSGDVNFSVIGGWEVRRSPVLHMPRGACCWAMEVRSRWRAGSASPCISRHPVSTFSRGD